MEATDIVLVIIGFIGVVWSGLTIIDWRENRKRRQAEQEYFTFKHNQKK